MMYLSPARYCSVDSARRSPSPSFTSPICWRVDSTIAIKASSLSSFDGSPAAAAALSCAVARTCAMEASSCTLMSAPTVTRLSSISCFRSKLSTSWCAWCFFSSSWNCANSRSRSLWAVALDATISLLILAEMRSKVASHCMSPLVRASDKPSIFLSTFFNSSNWKSRDVCCASK